MKIRNVVLATGIILCSTNTSYAASEQTEVMAPIHDFFSALARRDKAGMVAQVAPHIEVVSERNGELRRRDVDTLADLVIAYRPRGDRRADLQSGRPCRQQPGGRLDGL